MNAYNFRQTPQTRYNYMIAIFHFISIFLHNSVPVVSMHLKLYKFTICIPLMFLKS